MSLAAMAKQGLISDLDCDLGLVTFSVWNTGSSLKSEIRCLRNELISQDSVDFYNLNKK